MAYVEDDAAAAREALDKLSLTTRRIDSIKDAELDRTLRTPGQAFHAALDNAHSKGELRRSVHSREEASFFTASVLGIFVMLRAKAPSKVIESAAQVAIEHLERLCAETTT